MGVGFDLNCRKCGYRITGMLGMGFMFPLDYGRTMEAARAGKYGERIRRFLEEHPDGVLNAERVFQQCDECGSLECGPDLSMYIRKPETPQGGKRKRSGTASHPGTDYVSSTDLKDGKSYMFFAPGHVCGKCGKPMRAVSEEDLRENWDYLVGDKGRTGMICPKCREPMWVDGISMWD